MLFREIVAVFLCELQKDYEDKKQTNKMHKLILD